MNIFVLDIDPIKAAKYHCNSHVVKMILESAQLLCSVHHVYKTNYYIPYKLTHKNHPCSIWTRESLSNYNWLLDLGFALCEEYEFRYNKKHKTKEILKWCKDNKPKIQDKGLTNFVQAMPEKYRCKDVVNAYRNYYNKEKRHLFKWMKREIPYWIKNEE